MIRDRKICKEMYAELCDEMRDRDHTRELE